MNACESIPAGTCWWVRLLQVLTQQEHTIFASGEVFHTVAGTPLYVNRTGSDGSIQNFYKDGSSVGSIGANSGTPYMSGNLGGFRANIL